MVFPNDSLLAGSVAGGVCRLLTAPLDVLKVRLQLQIEPVSKYTFSSKYHSLSHAIKLIFREEGFTAFWKGFVPGEALYIIYGGVQFGMFEHTRQLVKGILPDQNVATFPVVNFMSGCVAGATATAVSFPFDVLRTRMIGQGKPKLYPNMFKAMVMMYHENGVRTFYRGLSAALTSVAPQAGIQFASYHFLLTMWDKLEATEGNVRSLACGGLAGVFTKVALLPLDLAKKRLAIQGFEAARYQFGRVQHYSGLVNCLITILRNEGMLGFFKGTQPAIIKAAVTTSLYFTLYEYALGLVVRTRSQNAHYF